jgi:hypothetical protein
MEADDSILELTKLPLVLVSTFRGLSPYVFCLFEGAMLEHGNLFFLHHYCCNGGNVEGAIVSNYCARFANNTLVVLYLID